MKRLSKKIIELHIDDDNVIQIEIEQPIIDFYKKETGRTRVTEKGLSDFFTNLFRLFTSR